MNKIVFCFCICFFALTQVHAQSGNIEIRKVMDLFQSQQFDEVISYLHPMEKADPNNIEVLGYLGYAHYMNENSKTSRKYYERVLDIDSNNIQALRYLVEITANRAPDSSMLFDRRLIVLQPRASVHYRNLGEQLRRTPLKDSALTYLQKAYALLPTDPKNGAALADILIYNRTYFTADSIIAAGLKLDSLSPSFLRLAVKSGYESENYTATIAPGETLIRLEEPALTSISQLILSYYELKKYEDSYRVCQYLIDAGLDPEKIYYYQSRAAAKMKKFDKSTELLQICLSKAISETAEQYYYNLGQNYEATKDFRKAIKQYDTAFYLFKDANMMYYIASIYETHLRDQGQAKKYYLKFLALAKPRNANELKAVKYVREKWGGGAVNDSVASSRKKDEE